MSHIVAAGDVHGALSEFYRSASEFGTTIEQSISVILQVGGAQTGESTAPTPADSNPGFADGGNSSEYAML